MKLLRIVASGLPLFKDNVDISLVAQQKVFEQDHKTLYNAFSNIYLNCSNAFVGINASGKTSTLKLIILTLKLLSNEPINHIETKDILGTSNQAKLKLYFLTKANEVCLLETVVGCNNAKPENIHYSIIEERLWSKSIKSIKSKSTLFDFSTLEPTLIRKDEEFLSDDVSIIIANNKKSNEVMEIANLLSYTNMNVLPYADEIPLEVIAFLDPTVEKLFFDKDENSSLIHLKFKGKEEIILNNAVELNKYLSSGTIKGIISFSIAKDILKSGGYMVIDEIENHFNREIISILMRFFMDSKLNRNGGTLIFSTHYAELLDEYNRNDSIFLTSNSNGIQVKNLSKLLDRNDIKKSDAYLSGYIDDSTTPAYKVYLDLKHNVSHYVNL